MRTHTVLKTVASIGAAALVASGCSTGGGTTSGEPGGADSATSQESEQFNDADVEYLQGMAMHHQQAIEMSDIVIDKSDVDSDVVTMAKQIKKAQGPEIEQMESWLDDWGQDSGGHGQSGGGHDMGMMSDQDLEKLKDADGDQAGTLFLAQMIEHHEGAVEMAQDHRREGQSPEALELSATVIEDQKAEIKEMRDLRASL